MLHAPAAGLGRAFALEDVALQPLASGVGVGVVVKSSEPSRVRHGLDAGNGLHSLWGWRATLDHRLQVLRCFENIVLELELLAYVTGSLDQRLQFKIAFCNLVFVAFDQTHSVDAVGKFSGFVLQFLDVHGGRYSL